MTTNIYIPHYLCFTEFTNAFFADKKVNDMKHIILAMNPLVLIKILSTFAIDFLTI